MQEAGARKLKSDLYLFAGVQGLSGSVAENAVQPDLLPNMMVAAEDDIVAHGVWHALALHAVGELKKYQVLAQHTEPRDDGDEHMHQQLCRCCEIAADDVAAAAAALDAPVADYMKASKHHTLEGKANVSLAKTC